MINGRTPPARTRNAGFSDSMVLLTRPAAYANRTHHFAVTLQRNSPREDHDPSVVGRVDSKELASGLAVLSQVLGGNIERPGRPCLVDRNVHAPDPCIIHTDVGDKVTPAVHDRNIHRLPDFARLLFRGANYLPRVCKCHNVRLLKPPTG